MSFIENQTVFWGEIIKTLKIRTDINFRYSDYCWTCQSLVSEKLEFEVNILIRGAI